MKSILKTLLAGIAVSAAPAYYAYSQTTTPTPSPTPAPTPTPSAGSVPYIPLFVTPGGQNGMSGTTTPTPGAAANGTLNTWFIDVARNRIVLCTQAASGTGGSSGGTPAPTPTPAPGGTTAGAAQNVTCTAQPLPT